MIQLDGFDSNGGFDKMGDPVWFDNGHILPPTSLDPTKYPIMSKFVQKYYEAYQDDGTKLSPQVHHALCLIDPDDYMTVFKGTQLPKEAAQYSQDGLLEMQARGAITLETYPWGIDTTFS